MPCIKANTVVEDSWTTVEAAEALEPGTSPIVSLEVWEQERGELARRPGPLGIRLDSDEPPTLIARDLCYFDLVALELPTFADGRACSYARLLRERYGFTGELRAVGHVLPSQLQFLAYSGFDAFEIAEEADPTPYLEALPECLTAVRPTPEAASHARERSRIRIAPRRAHDQAELGGCAAVWAY